MDTLEDKIDFKNTILEVLEEARDTAWLTIIQMIRDGELTEEHVADLRDCARRIEKL